MTSKFDSRDHALRIVCKNGCSIHRLATLPIEYITLPKIGPGIRVWSALDYLYNTHNMSLIRQ